jgi:Peptidase A4 family
MTTKRLLGMAAISIAGATLVASSASAATDGAQVSSNWAGYEASGAQFSKVSGTWVQPKASCNGESDTAAFWVGLGGASAGSQELEQAGTEVDCSGGSPTYSTWYELVPAGAVTTNLQVKPGDTVSAAVAVDGNQVSIAMTDRTTGQSFDKTLAMDNPDTSSAEWIAEAPSACTGGASGDCQTLPLADFGKVTFTDASATANGHTGPISDPQWTATAVQLVPGASGGFGGGEFGAGVGGAGEGSTAGATPSGLSSGGSAFSVSWDANAALSSSPGQAVVPQTGDGYGDGGYGYDPGYGYGYGGGYGYDGGGYGYDPGAGYLPF